MTTKLLASFVFIFASLTVQAEYLASAEQHLLPSLARENCRLSVPSQLVSLGKDQVKERFAVYPMRPNAPKEFCRSGEMIEVEAVVAAELRHESELYIGFMTMAVHAMAESTKQSRGDLSRDDTFFQDHEYAVFNYRVANLYQGDKCQVLSDKALRVVGFLGPKGVLVRYENDMAKSENNECPEGTIILVRQEDLISRV